MNLIWNNIEKEWTDHKEFLEKINLNKQKYHGGLFEGLQCQKILQSTTLMRDFSSSDIHRYIGLLESFEVLTKSCFGKNLSPDFVNDMNNFKKLFRESKIKTHSTKIHILLTHVPQFCISRDKGLSLYSEQAGETIHSRFRQFSEFKISKSSNSKTYGDDLKKVVTAYNVRRL